MRMLYLHRQLLVGSASASREEGSLWEWNTSICHSGFVWFCLESDLVIYPRPYTEHPLGTQRKGYRVPGSVHP